MLNYVVLVGRVVDIVLERKDDKNILKLTISVPRYYKNVNGEYENDIIETILSVGIGEKVQQALNKDDVVGIKGRVQNNNDKIEIIAEKVTFLSSKKKEEDDSITKVCE